MGIVIARRSANSATPSMWSRLMTSILSLISLISIIACQQGFDKDGSEINETNEYGETVDSDGNSLSTSNHAWDEDGYTQA